MTYAESGIQYLCQLGCLWEMQMIGLQSPLTNPNLQKFYTVQNPGKHTKVRTYNLWLIQSAEAPEDCRCSASDLERSTVNLLFLSQKWPESDLDEIFVPFASMRTTSGKI